VGAGGGSDETGDLTVASDGVVEGPLEVFVSFDLSVFTLRDDEATPVNDEATAVLVPRASRNIKSRLRVLHGEGSVGDG